MTEWISATCEGVRCTFESCGEPAYAKVGEEIPFDDPRPARHNLTAYLCRRHFTSVMGDYGVNMRARFIAGEPTI